MGTDLKAENNKSIFLILTASVLLSAGFQLGFTKLPGWSEAVIAGTASTLLSAVLVMFCNLLSHDIKHKLIFTRVVNEMPASRIHRLSQKDPRIDTEQAKTRWPEVFDDNISPDLRNSRWYQQIYKSVKDNPEVRQAHRNFLLYRDVFSGMVVLLVLATAWHWLGDPGLVGPLVPAVFYTLSGFTLIALFAARFAGNRFVINAVAAAL